MRTSRWRSGGSRRRADVPNLRLAATTLDHPGGQTESVGEKALTGVGTKAESGRAVETLRPSF